MSTLTRKLQALVLTSLAVLAAPAAIAQADFPNKPIRLVVTFPPGGSADAVVRMITPRLSEKLGQQVLVENRPGAGGNIGLSVVAKAPPDGYTLGLGAAGALAANSSLYPNMPFDVLKDFKPITMLVAAPFVIVGHPSIAPRTQPRPAGSGAQGARQALAPRMVATARRCTWARSSLRRWPM